MRRAVANTTGANLLAQAMGAVSGILLARMLGPEGRGELATVVLWPSILGAVCLLGTDSEISRRGALASGLEPRLIEFAIMLSSLLGAAGILAGMLLLPWLLPGDKHHLMELARIMLIVIPASMLNVLLFSLALGRGSYAIYNFTRTAFSPIYIALLIGIGLLMHPSLELVAAAYLSAAFLSAFFTLIIVTAGREREQRTTKNATARDVIASALPFAGSSAAQIASNQLPQVLVVFLTDARAVGLYVVAMVVASAHYAFGNAMAKISFASAARMDPESSTKWIAQNYRYAILIYTVISIFMLAVAPPLVPWVFGRKFEESGALLYALIPATTFVAMAQIVDHVLRGRRQVKGGIAARAVSGVTLVVLCLLLAPRMGVQGIAVAAAITAAVELIVMTRTASRSLGIPLVDFIRITGHDCRQLVAKVMTQRRRGQ